MTIARTKWRVGFPDVVAHAATTLSASRRSEGLALRAETLHSLLEKHGELLDKYWRDQVGIGIDLLTEAEAGYLLRAPSVDAIRTGMAQARGG